MEKRKAPAVVALGMFDGVHIGHTQLLERTVALADGLGAMPAAHTFRNHPLTVLGRAPLLLLTAEERAARMRACGIADVALETFTEAYASLLPEAYVTRLLERWDVKVLVAGYNYTFGRYGAGTPETLCALGAQYGFDVCVLEPVLVDGAPVSSSRIRASLFEGDAALAARLLGRPYRFTGTVVENLKNGRLLGFPTANIEPDALLAAPKPGVYLTRAETPDGAFPAVTNIGNNPTLHGRKQTVETHLIGFSGNLYGKPLTVSFLERIRDDIAFKSTEALRAQIERDVAYARTAENVNNLGNFT